MARLAEWNFACPSGLLADVVTVESVWGFRPSDDGTVAQVGHIEGHIKEEPVSAVCSKPF
jgi:hypothetical protein